MFFLGKLSPNSVVLKLIVLVPFPQRKFILKSLTYLVLFLHSFLEHITMLEMRVMDSFILVSTVALFLFPSGWYTSTLPNCWYGISVSIIIKIWNCKWNNYSLPSLLGLDKKSRKFSYSTLLCLWRLLPYSVITHSFSGFSSPGSYTMFDCILLTTIKPAYPFKWNSKENRLFWLMSCQEWEKQNVNNSLLFLSIYL